jgi:pimeloyl-ACP methyl ester carboxylesterase
MATLNQSATKPSTPMSISNSARKIGLGILQFLGLVIALAIALPVGLLPFATGVPIFVWLPLVLVDLALIVAPLRFNQPLAYVAVLGGSMIVSAIGIMASQLITYTPPIAGANSIAVLEKVKLGGSDEWITIRGKDKTKPVLLFLAGGPGGGTLGLTRQYLTPLEDYFVVVNWEQPVAGKSYSSVPIATLTVDRYIADAHELTELLRARFHQDKIYLLGESWGTVIGIKLSQKYPELYHAYVGTGQMITTTSNDVMGYELALKYATEQGDTATVESLRKMGPPPYVGDGMFIKYSPYLGVLNKIMSTHTGGKVTMYDMYVRHLLGPEYGWVDKVNWYRGFIDAFTVVYPQIADLDFTTQATQLNVPVYFAEGRHDVNAMTSLVEKYYSVLQAPRKELIWFEESGHDVMYGETARFVDMMANRVLTQTQVGR